MEEDESASNGTNYKFQIYYKQISINIFLNVQFTFTIL